MQKTNNDDLFTEWSEISTDPNGECINLIKSMMTLAPLANGACMSNTRISLDEIIVEIDKLIPIMDLLINPINVQEGGSIIPYHIENYFNFD